MRRLLVVFCLLVPGLALAQSMVSSAACTPLPPTLESEPMGAGSLDFFRVDGSAPGPRVQPETSGLEFALSGPQRVRRNQPLNLRLRVTNRGRRDAVVMRSMDGSTEHMREPSYDLYVRVVGSDQSYRWAYHGGRCGMINAVNAEDYVRIPAGATNDTLPGEWGPHLQNATISAAGHYEAWVVYRYCDAAATGMRMGADAAGPSPTRGEFASNAFRFHVR